jgi:hypothetical protein
VRIGAAMSAIPVRACRSVLFARRSQNGLLAHRNVLEDRELSPAVHRRTLIPTCRRRNGPKGITFVRFWTDPSSWPCLLLNGSIVMTLNSSWHGPRVQSRTQIILSTQCGYEVSTVASKHPRPAASLYLYCVICCSALRRSRAALLLLGGQIEHSKCVFDRGARGRIVEYAPTIRCQQF